MINLLHLSDLHFGYADATASAQRAQALGLLVKELARLEDGWRPQILVISGDLTWQGKPAEYEELMKWLTEKLFPATGLTAADCVICAGNHDIDRKTARPLLRRTGDPKDADEVLRPEYLAEGFARPFKAFVAFAESFGIPPPTLHGEPNHLAGVIELKRLQFVCVNSAWFCRDSETDRGQLWLGLPQLQSMPLIDPDDYDTASITVAVLHHPQDWFANPEYSAYDNRPNTYRYLAERSHVILSGHTHGAVERSTRCYDRARLFLAGATYDNHAYRNNFSLLGIDRDARTVIRRAWELDPRGLHWGEKKRETWSLRTEGLVRETRNPATYVGWLRDQTQSIELHQLEVEPGKTPPPAMDLLYIRLMTAAPAAESEPMERAQPVPLEEALRHRRLVIEGKPGGGKTTFVRWIAWMLCRPAGPPPDLPVQGFPLWVRISQLDQHITNTLADRQRGDPALSVDARWITHFLASQGWGLDEAFFRDKLEMKDTILLLDGLDEAANEQRRAEIVETIKWAAQYPCRIVVTTRPGTHEGRSTLVGFEKASIEDLDPAGIETFLLQWCRWLKRGDEVAALGYLADLLPAAAVPSIRILARNPLMLTALAVLYLRRHRLPEQRARLYEQILDWLADRRWTSTGNTPKTKLLSQFGRPALGMQESQGGQRLQIGIDVAARLLTQPGQSLDAAHRFLKWAQVHSGIIMLRGEEIAFWHHSFQEYLAARTLAGFPDAKLFEKATTIFQSAEGREVLLLLASILSYWGNERLDGLILQMLRFASTSSVSNQARSLVIVAAILRDLSRLIHYQLPRDAELAANGILETFSEPSVANLDLRLRFELAAAVSQLGFVNSRIVEQIKIPVSVLLDHAVKNPDVVVRELSISALLDQHLDDADVRWALIQVARTEWNQPFRRRVELAFEDRFPPWKRWLAGIENEATIPELLEVNAIPFRAVRLRLRNIKAFEDTGAIDLTPGGTLFVGENSVGKSTLLRCIALAALGPGLASEVDRPLSYLRYGAEYGAIEVAFELQIDSDAAGKFVIGLAIHSGEIGFRVLDAAKHNDLSNCA